MALDAKASNSGTAPREVSSASKPKKKMPPFAKIIRGLFAVGGTVAPKTTSRIAKRMIFTPTRGKPRNSSQAIFAAARTEIGQMGQGRVCHYIWGESNRRVLLVHGWSGAAAQMAAFVEPLRQAGYQVVAVDLPAHGKSSGTTTSVKHFERTIAHTANQYGPFEAIIAHSLGASAVAYALSRGLKVERVVFLNPVSNFESIWRNSRQMMNLSPKVMQLVVERAEKWLGVSFAEMEPVRLAPSLSTPLLVVHDRGDRESPFEDGAALVAHWPQAKMLPTEKLGHTRALGDPDIVQRVTRFVVGQNV